jgi:hypothetical protein
MPRIKEIKETAPLWTKFNFLDIISKLDKSKTNKYTPMLIRVLTDKINKTYQNQEDLKYIAEELGNIFGLELHNFDVAEQVIFYKLYESILNNSDYQLINNFIELNEKKIENGVDVQKIETLEDMNRYLSIASLKMFNKELRNQVVVDYDSDEWLIIRPITFEASIKYGAGTKWCTTSESNPDHFFRYSKRGCLIYIINKLNGYKVACYKNFEEKQIEFYNQEDIRVDSMMVDLPIEILGRIKDIIMSTIISNKELDVEKWTMSEKLIEKNQLKIRLLEPTEPGHWVGEEEIQLATI